MNNSDQIKKSILCVFKSLIRFLEENDLTYIACGGTVLGAIRHHGFIPWDDDIDIYMPRRDYEKLISLRDELKKSNLEILSENNDGYYLPFAKVIDPSTTIWEYPQYEFAIGAFVDIFPLDEFDYSKKKITQIQQESAQQFFRYQQSLEKISFKGIIHDLFHLRYNSFKYRIWVILQHLRKKQLFDKFNKLKKEYTSHSGPYCVAVTQWEGKIFQTDWFKQTIDCQFEDTTIKIPKEYDAYLTLLYGDYLTPPPEEQRTSGHQQYFIDLTCRRTIEEIKRIKKNERRSS